MLTQIRMSDNVNPGIDLYYGARTGYDLLGVQGLEPPVSQMYTSEYAVIDGVRYHGSRVSARNLVLNVALKPDPTTSVLDLRRRLYNIFPTGRWVRLRLWESGGLEMRIDGYVESYEPNMFTKEPSLDISIMCPDPFFQPEMPFTHEFGAGDNAQFDYDGDIPTGFTADILITSNSVEWLQIAEYNQLPQPLVRLTYDFRSGQRLHIDTRPGSKRATIYNSSGGIVDRIVGKASTPHGWPMIQQGPNHIAVTSNVTSGYSTNIRYIKWIAGF